MKKTFFSSIVAAILLVALPVLTNAQVNPGEYMTKITTTLAQTKDEVYQYLKAISGGKSARKVEARRKKLIEQIQAASKELATIGNYKEDATLREAAREYLKLQKTILQEDYGKIVNLEEIAEQSYDNMEMYLLTKEKADEKMQQGSDTLSAAYKTFAATHNVNIIEGEQDKLSKKIEKMNETLHHNNEAYLITLKCSHQERYILAALEKGDINSIEQNINAQKALVEESYAKTDSLDAFEDDASLKVATRELLDFYKEEAEKTFPAMMDFYIKKDNFEKIKKNFDSKSKSERTQAAVDEFNKAVEEVNAGVKTFNDLNNKANQERKKKNEKWSAVAEEFVSRHSK